MSTITVFHMHGKYFIPVGPAVAEVEYSTLMSWHENGIEVNVIEGEQYV